MRLDAHAMVSALFDTPQEYTDALSEAASSPEQELAEALDDAEEHFIAADTRCALGR